MKYTNKFEVWQDKLSGQCYRRKYAFRPVVFPADIPGEAHLFGHVYEPCSAPANADIALITALWEASADLIGYPALCFGQNLFLTDHDVGVRFTSLGVAEFPDNTEDRIQQYTEERCNFDNKAWVAFQAVQQLPKMGGMSQCIWASILKEYLKDLPEDDMAKAIFENNKAIPES